MKIEPGGIFRRFFACLLDIFICIVVGACLTILYLKAFTNIDLRGATKTNLRDFYKLVWYAAILGQLLGRVVIPLYFIYFEQSKWQATPGKRLLKLKVINFDGSRLSLWKSCLRVFLCVLIRNIMLTLMYYIYPKQIKLILSDWSTLQAIKSQFITAPEYVILRLIGVIWFITILFTKNKTGIYEILSKTRVILVVKP